MSIRRDYKPTSTWQRRRRSARRHGLLVITLVLVGLFGGLLAYIKGDRVQQSAPVAAAAPTPGSAPVPSSSPAATKAPPAAPEIIPAPLKPKYDFYTELPKRQINFQQDSPGPHGALRPPSVRPQPVTAPLRKPELSRKSRITPT
ncbi:MAG: hypothetical protein WBQ37_18400 [Candidatus Competibacter sp.]